MESYENKTNRIGQELESDIQEIELPNFPDFYPELLEIINDFQKYKENVDIESWSNQQGKIINELEKISDINFLRKFFLFHLIICSTPPIEILESFDTQNKELANLIKRIINNNI